VSAPFSIRPFGFDEIFEVAVPLPQEGDGDDLRLRLAVLEAELALLRTDAQAELARTRAEAFAAGLAQAQGEQQVALLAAVDALHAAVEGVEDQMAAIAADAAQEAGVVAHAAAELLAGHALAAAPATAVDAAIGRALRQVARGQEVQVVVHPDLVDAVEDLIATRQAADRRRLHLSALGDPQLAPGDAHVRWDTGGIVLDAAARAAAVRAAMADLLPD